MRRLWKYILDLFGMADGNDILDDNDNYDTGTLMAHIKPGEKLDTTY